MKIVILMVAMFVGFGMSSEIKEFSGYWVVDMAKVKETMTAEEKAEISKIPEVMLKMVSSIVIKIEDKSVTAFVMSKAEKGECKEFIIQGNELKTSCKQEGATKFKEIIAKRDGKWLFTSRPTSGKGLKVDNLAFVRVSDAEAQTIIKSQPTQEDFQQMMMMMLQKSLQEKSGGLQITP